MALIKFLLINAIIVNLFNIYLDFKSMSLFKTIKTNWNSYPQFRRNMVAAAIIGISLVTLATYISPFGKNHRVGYKNPKITMDYAAKNSDTPNLNQNGLAAILGNKTDCHKHAPLGSPDISQLGLTNAAMICHNAYATIFNLDTKTPVVVSHVLTRSDFLKGKYVERETQFTEDPIVNGEGFPVSNDYRGTNYDRGHLMPAADASHDEDYMKETFYMTNIAPQAPNHNRGVWQKLEKDVRELLKRGKVCVPVQDKETFDEIPQNERCSGTQLQPYQRQVDFEQLYITTGVLFHVSSNTKKIPQLGNPENGSLGTFKSGIKIPNYFYKIIFEPRTGMSAAYLIPNLNEVGNESYHKFLIPLTDLEKKYANINYYNSLSNKDSKKFKKFYTETNTNETKLTGGRNGMLDRFLF